MAAYYHHSHATTQIPTAAPNHLHHHFHHPPPPHQESITLYGYPQLQAREVTRVQQGLSLALSSQSPDADGLPPPEIGVVGGGKSLVLGSKYLNAAQELLEEVVHVDDGIISKSTESPKKRPRPGNGAGEPSVENHSGGNGGGGQLSSAEKQELLMKKAKLVNMLDETEQRYRQYHNQIQNVIESFEQAAGIRSAKAYTALALKTISRQFQCLEVMIQGQIKATRRKLGEEGGSRMKYMDHQIRQHRAMEELGMIQNPISWRPQRGLPETCVSVLRAWLFEHFLHPYPKDSDKIMLAKQTGLTMSQVSNWFINARVRLWKPMIEEMYKDEIKEQEQNGLENKSSSKENSYDSNSTTNQEVKINIADQNQAKNGLNLKDQNPGVSSTSPLISISSSSIPLFKGNNNSLPQNQHGFPFTNSLGMEESPQGSPKRPRNYEIVHSCETNKEIFIKFRNDKQGKDNGYPMNSVNMNFLRRNEQESYPKIGEIGRFETQEFSFLPGNGISLSLGLPPCENQQQQLSLSATSHSFLSPNNGLELRRANGFGSMSSLSPHSSSAVFECIDIQNRKGFRAQLLPGFVA